jgi:uroporphyrinogen decarboxylase
MLRRNFLLAAAAAPMVFSKTTLSHKQRVDRASKGGDVDRPPFSFWHHFGLETPEAHAKATLDFHREYHTDLVKVMSDFAYPKPQGKWYELKVEANPFPQQLKALELIKDGLGGDAYYIETIFNPWNVAEKLSSKDELNRLKNEKPQALLDALDVITKSEILHAKLALAGGASGVLLSVANAKKDELSTADYQKFSAPFDKRILEAISNAKLNILHLHVEPEYLDFFHGWPSAAINYSAHVSQIPVAEVRRQYPQVIMGGLDEVNFRKLDENTLRTQWESASRAAGKKFLLAPGCSVPNDSAKDELSRLPHLLGAS